MIFQICKIVLKQCVSELEEITYEADLKSYEMKPIMQESIHPYTDDSNLSDTVKIEGYLSNHILYYYLRS